MYSIVPLFSLTMASVGRNMEEKLLRLNTLLLMNICAISWNKYIICEVNNCMVTAVAFHLILFLVRYSEREGKGGGMWFINSLANRPVELLLKTKATLFLPT